MLAWRSIPSFFHQRRLPVVFLRSNIHLSRRLDLLQTLRRSSNSSSLSSLSLALAVEIPGESPSYQRAVGQMAAVAVAVPT
jgi:hypothetical protein